jgi:hypothetical protein
MIDEDDDSPFTPSRNPFTSPNNEMNNFPTLPDDYFDNADVMIDDDDDDEDEEDEEHYVDNNNETRDLFNHSENATHVSLNLSIDTLAKIKPVEISNVDSFLKGKHSEEKYEQTIRENIEKEDSEFFANRREELSPQTKSGKRTVLFDPESGYTVSATYNGRVVSVQTDLSISPAEVCYSSCLWNRIYNYK